jgi:hypothetical protein
MIVTANRRAAIFIALNLSCFGERNFMIMRIETDA